MKHLRIPVAIVAATAFLLWLFTPESPEVARQKQLKADYLIQLACRASSTSDAQFGACVELTRRGY
jgi:hypothetical protein